MELNSYGSQGTRSLLQRHRFVTKKQLGQNFLIDTRILDGIVEAVDAGERTVVLEVGPGAGALTAQLAERAKRVIAIEKDESLQPVLADSLGQFDNVRLLFEDCLKVDLEALLSPLLDAEDELVFAANLPYYITTPILFAVLESALPVRRIVVMVQREVADRMVARPGGKDYGVLSVSVQYRASVKRLFVVPPSAFMPQPGVDSAVVLLDCEHPSAARVDDEARFFRVVRAAFAMRRKTLLNALSGALGIPKATCAARIEAAGIEGGARAETLSIEEFSRLAAQF